MKNTDPKPSDMEKPRSGSRVMKWLVVGLIVALAGTVGIRKLHEKQAAEVMRQELAKAEMARIEAEQTIQNAHKFFADGKWDEAAVWCGKAALAGDVTAQRNWGECLEKGLGVKACPEEAVKWYRKAMAAGDVAAKIRLAACLIQGSGETKDVAAALQLYQEAAGLPAASALRRF